jgi:hypothetical protein
MIFSLFLFSSCIPVLISRAIKEEKQLKHHAAEVLTSKGLSHKFIDASQQQESIISNRNNEELIFLHERTIYQHGNVYSSSSMDANSTRITYFDVVFLAQQKRVEVERHSVWAVIQLLEQSQVLEMGALNDDAIDRLVLKYGANRISSTTSNPPPVIIYNREGNR